MHNGIFTLILLAFHVSVLLFTALVIFQAHPYFTHFFKAQLKCYGLCSRHQVFLIYTHHLVQIRHTLNFFEIQNKHRKKSSTQSPKFKLTILPFISYCMLLVLPFKGVISRFRHKPPNIMLALGPLQNTHGSLKFLISKMGILRVPT